jgi:heme-degrading monooxygenase HmoA
MFARHVSVQLKPNCAVEYARTLDREIIPLLRKQKGFQDEFAFVTPNGTEAVAISFWEQKEHAEAYNREFYPQVLTTLTKFFEGTPQVRTYEVTNSTYKTTAFAAKA